MSKLSIRVQDAILPDPHRRAGFRVLHRTAEVMEGNSVLVEYKHAVTLNQNRSDRWGELQAKLWLDRLITDCRLTGSEIFALGNATEAQLEKVLAA